MIFDRYIELFSKLNCWTSWLGQRNCFFSAKLKQINPDSVDFCIKEKKKQLFINFFSSFEQIREKYSKSDYLNYLMKLQTRCECCCHHSHTHTRKTSNTSILKIKKYINILIVWLLILCFVASVCLIVFFCCCW